MPDFGIMRGFGSKLFGDKLYAGQLPTQLGLIGSIGVYDADAQAFFDRVTIAGGSLSITEKNAVNQLVLDMKSYGIWTKMKAIYPMVGASAAACSQNLKSSSFTGTFTSGWTFASTGVMPNGTSAYMNTNLIPSTAINLNSVSQCIYSRTILSGAGIMMGCNNTSDYLILSQANATLIQSQLNTIGSDYITGTITDSKGFLLSNRIDSTNVNIWRNSTKLNSAVKTSTNRPNLNYYIGARNAEGNPSNYDIKEYAFASLGDGFTDTEAANFYTAVQVFQTTLSRQV